MNNNRFKTRESQKQVEHILLAIFACITVGLICLSVVAAHSMPAPVAKAETPQKPNPFHDISLQAKAAYVLDLNTGAVLYEKNAESQLPLASLTKLITAVTALELIPDYTVVAVSKDALNTEGSSGLYPDERFKLRDLVSLTLVSSSNDGAAAVAAAVGSIERGKPNTSTRSYSTNETAFVADMNAKARALGMKQTYILNPTGLDQSATVAGAYGSAKDIASLFAYLLKNHESLIAPTQNNQISLSSADHVSHLVKNTNTIVDKIPGLLGSKTGFTDLAGGNLVIAFDAGFDKPIIVSVLGSTEEGRFDDVSTLVWTTLAYLKNQD